MSRLTRDEMIQRGILRIRDDDGTLHLAPLANPYALIIDGKTDPTVAEEFQKLSADLRKLGKIVETNIHADNPDEGLSRSLDAQIAILSRRLEELSSSLRLVPVELYSQATNPGPHAFYCDCCFLPMIWRNGPRNVVEKSLEGKIDDLETLTDEELEALVGFTEDELENLKTLAGPAELRKGRNHFAHKPKSKTVHERGPGSTLAKDLRNYIYYLAQDEGWTCEVIDGKKKTQVLVELTNKKNGKKIQLLLAPFGKLDPEAPFDGIIVTSNEKSGMFKRITIRGLTRAQVDVELTHDKFKRGNGDTVLIEDYLQERDDNGRRPSFERVPITFREALIGIMNGDLEFVENVHEIDGPDFRLLPKFAIVRTGDVEGLETRIEQDRYYADRRRIMEAVLPTLPGHTAEFDDRKEWKPRFAKGGLLFPTTKTRLGRSTIWSRHMDVKKVVVNPYGFELLGNRSHAPLTFNPDDWKNTLVIFHSRDKDAARSHRRAFENWITQSNIKRVRSGLAPIKKVDIGLVPFHNSDVDSVRAKIRGHLTQPRLDENMGMNPENDGASDQEVLVGSELSAGKAEAMELPFPDSSRLTDDVPAIRNVPPVRTPKPEVPSPAPALTPEWSVARNMTPYENGSR